MIKDKSRKDNRGGKMKEYMMMSLLEKCRGDRKIVIVGAGFAGETLYQVLKRQDIEVSEFWDNSDEKAGIKIGQVEVKKPYGIQDKEHLFIIAVKDARIKQELEEQLVGLGIDTENIIGYRHLPDIEYVSKLSEDKYPEVINSIYFQEFGKEVNFDNPVTYNEIINWEKLYLKDPVRTRLADKVEVRKWVREQIGGQYLTKWYGVWDKAEDIPFDDLPSSFVLKMNNGSGRNILVKDKSKLDIDAAVRTINEWKAQNYAFLALEMHYKDIKPQILCEEYLEGLAETVYDYNIYCFQGEPKYIWCIKGSHRPNCHASFYTTDWEMQPFYFGYPKDEEKAPRPEKLDEMLRLSKILCKDFKHVRVDWYNMPDGRVLFGEMTFASWGGMHKFVPEKYDLEFGNMIGK